MNQPNILFIMADQMSAKALAFYGHDVVKTPALSQLASEGVVFENAYCNSPLCGPSRLSMMSGLLPSKIGGYDNAPEFSSAIPTFAHYLRISGYLTCLSGKMHFAGPDQLHGFEQRLTTDIYPSDFGWTPNWSDPQANVRFQNMRNVLETGPCLRSLQIDYDDEVSYQANRWLYDRARDRNQQPFMLTVSFTSPHDPYVAQQEFWDIYSEDEIDLPKISALDLDSVDAHSIRINNHYSTSEETITDEIIKRARHGYYASISYIDSKVAALMKTLKNSGLSDSTIVVFASDHGDMMGERGMYYKKCFFEWATRVPLIFWAPEQYSPANVSTPVSLLDILPTFHEIGKGNCLDIVETDGHSLIALLKGESIQPRHIAGEYLAEGVFEPTFMLRNDHYKLFYSESDPPLLFNMQDDPDELENLANSLPHEKTLKSMLEIAMRLWNVPELKEKIIKDQNRRRLINHAHGIGKLPVWDFQPYADASQQYVRAGKWTADVEAKAHLAMRK